MSVAAGEVELGVIAAASGVPKGDRAMDIDRRDMAEGSCDAGERIIETCGEVRKGIGTVEVWRSVEVMSIDVGLSD